MKTRNRLISFFLTIVTLFTFSAAALSAKALAAPTRSTGTVKYLSDVAIINATSYDNANEIFEKLKEEKNGGYEGFIQMNLNEGGARKIYLAYKTSTNVDDAITDLAVMNMFGDYTVGNYEKVLSDTLSKYEAIAKDYGIMAEEFKANFNAGYPNAKIAHRQMNYYFIEKDDVKTYMGDYMLNFPEDKAEFAEILFYGNINVITNLRALLAMGIGNPDNTLENRIEEAFKTAETDTAIFKNSEYSDIAKAIKDDLKNMKEIIVESTKTIEECKNNEDETIPEEVIEERLANAENSLSTAKAFLESLKTISMGDTTLGDYVMNTDEIDENKLFPIVHAGTTGEKKMMEYHSFYNILIYDKLSSEESILNDVLLEFEKDFTPLSVYHGVQNDMQKGSIGVTGKAESSMSTTGQSIINANENKFHKKTCFLFTAGSVSLAVGVVYLSEASQNIDEALDKILKTYRTAKKQLEQHESSLYDTNVLIRNSESMLKEPNLSPKEIEKWTRYLKEDMANKEKYESLINSTKTEVQNLSDDLDKAPKCLSWGQKLFGGALITFGAISLAIAIYNIAISGRKYDINYLDIPDNMVDIISDDVNGDRFINYKNVKSYHTNIFGTLKSENNDLNALKGKEWLSLYYTKNHEAGKCLTATPDLAAGREVRAGYSPIHLFGHSSNANLNSYCNRTDAKQIFLSFKYSTNQKSADTDIPDVIGSSFNKGYIAISGFGCLALGMLAFGIVKKKKNVKKDEEAEDEVA